MTARNIYISVACNTTTECADWGNNGLIIFGANQAIGIIEFEENAAKIARSYRNHTNEVKNVKWLRRTPTEKEEHFLSGGDDGKVMFWTLEHDMFVPIELPTTCASITTLAGHYTTSKMWVLAVASHDSTISIFNFDGTGCLSTQTIDLNGGLCFQIAFATIPGTNRIFMACSMDSANICLWTRSTNDTEFQQFHQLSGHEDWVRSMDIVDENNDLLLASSSQDNYIRLWRISPRTKEQSELCNKDQLQLLNDAVTAESEGELLMKESIIEVSDDCWLAISVESIIYGHDNWVFGVQWHKTVTDGLRLMSASMDKTLIVWHPTEDGWVEEVRLGDVGGNSLGFYGGKLSPDGKSIMGYSFTGGFHFWTQDPLDKSKWAPSVTVGGHSAMVHDLCWEPEGEYLMSVSADQTTRIHAPWRRQHTDGKATNTTWHELARPQVHGYDIQALAILSRYRFASGAEEKIVRAFQAPANFIENFRHIAGIQADPEGDAMLQKMPTGASVPSLGLSNKAVYEVEAETSSQKHAKDLYPENYFVPVKMQQPPEEEVLMQNTLWPEVHKLYGHGYEIQALAASPDGRLLASACKSSTPEHAYIILWNTATWKQHQQLSGHKLTITQMRFSPNGRYLLSVSRDRRWMLFETSPASTTESELPMFKQIATTDKTNGVHQRIIWSCDWSHDSTMFATASRDGRIAVWEHNADNVSTSGSLNGWTAVHLHAMTNESFTALSFAPALTAESNYLLAVGSENGTLRIFELNSMWQLRLSIEPRFGHHLSVKRLQFRPLPHDDKANSCNVFHLASCSADYSVRIHEIVIDDKE